MFRKLARPNQQLSDKECIDILKTETRGVLSVLGDGGYPYGMPMNHWYNEEDGCLYFHSGRGGHRLDALTKCAKVSFCTYTQGTRGEGEWAWKVKSVIVFGQMEVISDMAAIADITRKLSYKFTQDTNYIETEIAQSAHKTLLLKLVPQHMCGKRVTEA